jgi:uncharacterized protein YprB with RNaseH-like and TPR domain
MNKNNKPRILFFDIETAPIVAEVWDLFDQNIGLNQIVSDWTILSWAAKWEGSNKVMYSSVEGQKNLRNDKAVLKEIWKLLDEADIVVTQNGISFDSKKLNARFIINGMPPTSSYKHIDTCRLARKHFKFTSNKLEYLTDKLNTKYKKLKHKKFPGHELWKECLKNNKEAWKEMKKYNIFDVLALEELYPKLIAYDHNNNINFALYNANAKKDDFLCKCGSTERTKYGYAYTKNGKFQRYKCVKCSNESRSNKSLLIKKP